MSSIPESIVVEQLLETPAEVVWEAITDKDQMRQWFFESISDFRPEPGFETEFIVHCDGTDYPHQWKVKEVDPGKRIAYGWRYGGIPGDSTVIWELSETPEGTRLEFTQEFHASFPEDNSVFSREAGIAGWKYFVCEQLPAFLKQTAQ